MSGSVAGVEKEEGMDGKEEGCGSDAPGCSARVGGAACVNVTVVVSVVVLKHFLTPEMNDIVAGSVVVVAVAVASVGVAVVVVAFLCAAVIIVAIAIARLVAVVRVQEN